MKDPTITSGIFTPLDLLLEVKPQKARIIPDDTPLQNVAKCLILDDLPLPQDKPSVRVLEIGLFWGRNMLQRSVMGASRQLCCNILLLFFGVQAVEVEIP